MVDVDRGTLKRSAVRAARRFPGRNWHCDSYSTSAPIRRQGLTAHATGLRVMADRGIGFFDLPQRRARVALLLPPLLALGDSHIFILYLHQDAGRDGSP